VRWIVEGRVRLVGERIQVSGIGDAERSVIANEAR